MFSPGEPPPRSRDKTLPALPCPSQSIPPRRAAAIRTSWTIDWFCLLLNILVPKSYSIYSLERPLSHSVFLRCIQAVVYITFSSVAGNHHNLPIRCIVNKLLGCGRCDCHPQCHCGKIPVHILSRKQAFVSVRYEQYMSRTGSRGKYVTRVSRSCRMVF